jgi:uncharacterized RDD family membrane protein YckC
MSDAAYSIGWWIESADEETYGPASRSAVQQLLREGIISKNTLIRHCTQESVRPVVDQPGMLEGLAIDERTPATGDRLEAFWPSSSRERLTLAEGDLPCARHKRPAVGVCLRCHAPYCKKCQMKPVKKQFYFCRHCQANHNNRRALAVILDGLLMYAVILPVMFIAGGFAGEDPDSVGAFFMISQLLYLGAMVLYVFRDPLMGGAGPGKRAVGMHVVQSKDGTSRLTYGQALIRFLPLLLPFVPFVEAVLIYRDPLDRRLGDRLAKTRVIDTSLKLVQARDKTRRRLAKKGAGPVVHGGEATLAHFARIGG